jgi:hypothetical protein
MVAAFAEFAADVIEDGTSTFASSPGAFMVVVALKASVVSEIPST